MAGFEFGEKLVVLKEIMIDSVGYAPGADFPYENLKLDMDLVERFLDQKLLARKARLDPKYIKEISKVNTAKIIKNERGVRTAVSWPVDEDLAEGVIDGRPSIKTPVTDDLDDEDSNPDDMEPKIIDLGTGYYNLEIDGKIVNSRKLRRKQIEKLKEEYL